MTDRPSIVLGTSGLSLVELTAAYAAVAGGRYPVRPRGLPLSSEANRGVSGWFAPGGSLDRGREWAPMLDLLWAAANDGTGRRAALSIPTFGKTGTSQDSRDAIFVGFAGELVVGVWVGHDDNRSLGKISGGTAPARIWRAFMAPATATDRRAGRALPYRAPQRRPPVPRPSPIPEEWGESEKALGELIEAARELFESIAEEN